MHFFSFSFGYYACGWYAMLPRVEEKTTVRANGGNSATISLSGSIDIVGKAITNILNSINAVSEGDPSVNLTLASKLLVN